MATDADDEDEPTGGPPPDPTMRAWRHPSEIASAEAAAARFRQQDARLRPPAGGPAPLAFHRPQPGERRSPFLYLALTAVAAAAAVVLVAVGTGLFYADVDGITQVSDISTGPLGDGTAAFPPPLSTGPPTSAPATTVVEMRPDMGAGAYADIDGKPARLAGITLAGSTLFTVSSALGGRTEVTVTVDGRSAPAAVLGRDDVTDVAVLRLTGEPSPELLTTLLEAQARTAVHGSVVRTGQSSRSRSGNLVYGTLTTSTSCPDAGGMALVDSAGHLLGIIVDTSDPMVAAVPIDDALAVARSLEAGTGPSAAWLGVTGRLSPKGGVQLTTVSAGSPADRIGLRAGDRLVEVNGTRVVDWNHLVWLVRQAGTGSALTLVVDRNGTRVPITATVGTRPGG